MSIMQHDLYDLAPVGYTTVSEKGLILEANTVHGYTPDVELLHVS